MYEDMEMGARGKSLQNLIGTMEKDDAKSIPSVMLKISAGPQGIEIEQEGGESEMEDGMESHYDTADSIDAQENGMKPPMKGNGFDMLIAKKKKGY